MHNTIKSWLNMTRNELDNIYKSTTPGVIPTGDTIGTGIFATKTFITKIIMVVVKLFFWKGKIFYTEKGKKKLINKVTPFGLHLIIADVYKGSSWMDSKETIILDYSKSFIARCIRDEIREVEPGLYLGKVWFFKLHVCDFALEI